MPTFSTDHETGTRPDQATVIPPHAAVCGLQWGDEGKGKVVDLLTEQYDTIVRYNGGANAGHTVVVGDDKYALHLIPSGILYPDKLNVIGNGVVVDPEKVIQEIAGLRDRGITIAQNLRLSNRAHIVMPYHKVQDGLQEAALGKSRGDGKKIGTTGRGIGPCYADKMTRSTAVRFADLVDADHFRDKLTHIAHVKNAQLQALADYAEVDYTPIDPDALADTVLGWYDQLKDHICDTGALLHDAMDTGHKLLFEGANACMLDIDHGTFPFVTSSNCSSLGIFPGSGVPGDRVRTVVGIMKAYTTRVGGGPFVTEQDNDTGQRIRDRGNEYGTTTGRPRRCGWLDLAVVKYSARICGVTDLAVMLLDVLSGFDTLKVCVGYERNGEILPHFPADSAVLEQVTPIYEEVEGFAEELEDVPSYDALPDGAKRYIQLIERHTGVRVSIVSYGPKRSQTIVRHPIGIG